MPHSNLHLQHIFLMNYTLLYFVCSLQFFYLTKGDENAIINISWMKSANVRYVFNSFFLFYFNNILYYRLNYAFKNYIYSFLYVGNVIAMVKMERHFISHKKLLCYLHSLKYNFNLCFCRFLIMPFSI